jgi:hypothetical protein
MSLLAVDPRVLAGNADNHDATQLFACKSDHLLHPQAKTRKSRLLVGAEIVAGKKSPADLRMLVGRLTNGLGSTETSILFLEINDAST